MPGPTGTVTNSPEVDGGTHALCATALPGGCTGAEHHEDSDISAGEGQKIVKEAATWAGTAYSLVGAASVKGKGGDCSGSTFKIYAEAGFPYAYNATATFAGYAKKSGRFRKVDTATESMQAGDLLYFGHHMAIYAGFAKNDANATTTRENKKGKPWLQVNDMWTATHTGGDPYEASRMAYFGKPTVYRYQKVPVGGK